MLGGAMTFVDILAIILFIAAWWLHPFLLWLHNDSVTLVRVVYKYRLQWMKHMLCREDRTSDLKVISNIMFISSFFAVLSVLVVCLAVLMVMNGEKLLNSFSEVPFVSEVDMVSWSFKNIFLVSVLVYGFFKFTWVIRQLNYASILVSAAPVYHKGEDDLDAIKKLTKYAVKAAGMLTNANRHFNLGVRSFYFAIPLLSWHFSPYLMMLLTIVIMLVNYRREFMSKTLTLIV